MSMTDAQARQQAARQGQWRRLPLIESRRLRWALALGGVVYLMLALASVEVNWARVAEGAGFCSRTSLAAKAIFWRG